MAASSLWERTRVPRQGKHSHPLSGYERNRLFINEGARFRDASALSGIDYDADGRAFATADFDRDGRTDLAIVNANAPLLQLARCTETEHMGFVAFRLVGGNRTAEPSRQWSNRDGYGARITVFARGRRLTREHRCGEGLAAQNSATVRVGLGDAPRADRVEVRWPSGRRTSVGPIPAGSLVTVYENPADGPDGADHAVASYR